MSFIVLAALVALGSRPGARRGAGATPARLPRSGFLLGPAPSRRFPRATLLRSTLPDRGDLCAFTTGEPRGLRRFAPARWGTPAPSTALSEEDPLAGAPRGDENTEPPRAIIVAPPAPLVVPAPAAPAS